MPTFCRHNRLIQNCPICSREQSIEARPIVSSSAPAISRPRSAPSERGATAPPPRARASRAGGRATGVRVRQLVRGQEDGYHCGLIPGVKSSADAARLAGELAFSQARLRCLSADPPALYAEAAGPGDLEERTWLTFLIAYLGPLETDDPFAEIARVRESWSEPLPDLADAQAGPRGAHDPAHARRTLEAYRAWASRYGSQAAAFGGEAAWTPQRRFARAFERLALPGLHRDARFELLVSLGRLGLYELEAASLALGGGNEVTIAAKRALGIGDPLLLERRAQTLAEAAGLPLDALDLGLYSWERGERVHAGVPVDLAADPVVSERVRDALGL
ncbi:MAG TPA: hypothetical protein VLP43_10485 [Solirubrobacteraceae bacterium]|nr:hypothetical protein [Solirubrobacteraceae bacterium]